MTSVLFYTIVYQNELPYSLNVVFSFYNTNGIVFIGVHRSDLDTFGRVQEIERGLPVTRHNLFIFKVEQQVVFRSCGHRFFP